MEAQASPRIRGRSNSAPSRLYGDVDNPETQSQVITQEQSSIFMEVSESSSSRSREVAQYGNENMALNNNAQLLRSLGSQDVASDRRYTDEEYIDEDSDYERPVNMGTLIRSVPGGILPTLPSLNNLLCETQGDDDQSSDNGADKLEKIEEKFAERKPESFEEAKKVQEYKDLAREKKMKRGQASIYKGKEKFADRKKTCRFRITFYGNKLSAVQQVANQLVIKAKIHAVKISGPVHLPKKNLRISCRRTPCGQGSKTWDNWDMTIYKHYIDLECTVSQIKEITSITIPKGVEITVDFKLT